MRPAVFIEAVHPVDLHEGFAEQELARSPIQHVHQAVAIGPQHDFAHPALELDVGEYGNLSGVVVHLVVWRELVIPLQLAGVGVERDHTIRI